VIRVAILGAAHPHLSYVLDELPHRPGCRLVAAAEDDPAMRAQYLSGLDVPVYARVDDLLADHEIDVAVVAGVYARRADAVLAALAAGAHVLADKPLCTTLDQLAAIEQRGGEVSLLLEKRFHPATLAAADLLADGVLGELALVAATGPHKLNAAARPDWFWRRDHYGGIASDLPVHDIDLVLHLTGATSGTVAALTGAARRPDFDDHVAVLLRAGDVAATIEANWMSPEAVDVHGHYRMRLAGTLGTAELDWAYHRLTVATHDRDTWSVPLGPPVRPAAYFFDALSNDQPPAIGTSASLLATRVALLAQASADAGGEPQGW
jgi:predicted dehydrogenase